ncbi:MAG: ABC transporter permease subunit [Betaproteobacteria bacterium]|nr:MAG: ABC transporter permease subunit [Betaproteobacteria bacterium]
MIVGDVAITSPVTTLGYAIELLPSSDFRPHLAASLTAFGNALLISYAGGVLLGLTLGFHRFSGEVAEPMLGALYSLPKIALYPIILQIFGLGLSAKVAFGALHGVIPVALFSMNAVRGINPMHLRTARVLRLSSIETVRTIVAPAIIPEIVTGLRVGFSLTLLGVLIGEMFASQHGMGFLLINAINLHDVKMITTLIFVLFLFATVTSAILLAIDRRLHVRV